MHTLNKDVSVLSTGYGNINEWGSTFLEKERTRHNLYIGKVTETIRATITRKRSGAISPVFGSWLDWEAGDSNYLRMKWITDRRLSIDPEALKWYKDGEATSPLEESRKEVHAVTAATLRCQAAGVPGLPLLCMRHHLIAEAYTASRMVNEPVLWVPRNGVDDPINLVEKVLTYICSGAGSVNNNLYWLMRGICIDSLKETPWSLWRLSGGRAEIMMADLGKVPGVLAKILKVIKSLILKPHAMLGIKSPLTKEDFGKCVPWFLIDDASEEIPSVVTSWITARRVDSTDRAAETFIPAEKLGIPSWRDIVSFVPIDTIPKQIPPVSSSVVQELVS